ncbi:MAG TPA: sensor histidine kinase, partial [Acidimicrobiia bacterium]|nr:sensor histidine kinase [Acidimicrobiia bacterium]
MAPETITRTRDFRHEALFYEGRAEFVRATVQFVRDGLAAGEAVMVATLAEKIAAVKSELGAEAAPVTFADMQVIGRNPARIIEAWHEFITQAAAAGMRSRGIGEPAYAERSAAELRECAHHESLLNDALASTECWLLCPYDTSTLDITVLDGACANHPVIVRGEQRTVSTTYRAPTVQMFAEPLPAPPEDANRFMFDLPRLHTVREIVVREARRAGFSEKRAYELAVAAGEISTNSIQHGGASGTLAVWRDDGHVWVEIRDAGHIHDLLVGRLRPSRAAGGGYGVWLANCLCD